MNQLVPAVIFVNCGNFCHTLQHMFQESFDFCVLHQYCSTCNYDLSTVHDMQ